MDGRDEAGAGGAQAPPEAMEHGLRRRDRIAAWSLVGAAVLVALAGLLLPGRGTGYALTLCLAITFALAPVLALTPPPGDRIRPPPWLRGVQGAVTVLYNLGWMLLVLGVLQGVGVVDVPYEAYTLAPLFPVLFLPLLALAVRWRAAHGGLYQTTRTRVQAALLGVLALPLLAVAWTGAADVSVAGLPRAGDLGVFVASILGILIVGTQGFLHAGLPTLYAVVTRRKRAGEREAKEVQGTPPLVYAALVAVGATALLWWVVARLDLAQRVGVFRQERAIFFLVLLPAALAVFLLVSALLVWRDKRRGLYKRRIPTKLRNDIAVYGIAAALGVVGAYLLARLLLGEVEALGPFPVWDGAVMDVIAFTVVATTAPVGFYMSRQIRRVNEIEQRLPDFLSDLAETHRAGLTLTAALHSLSKADYGAFTREVETMSKQVAWGVSFTEALARMAERVDTALVRRAAYLIIEASRTGGSVTEVLKAAASDAYEIKSIESDRRATMMTYLVVIYVVFAVFILVIAVLQTRFIPEVLGAAQAQQQGQHGLEFIQGTGLDPAQIAFTYYNAAIVQSIGNGIVGGILSEGRMAAGLRHVAIMTALAWVTFRLLLG